MARRASGERTIHFFNQNRSVDHFLICLPRTLITSTSESINFFWASRVYISRYLQPTSDMGAYDSARCHFCSHTQYTITGIYIYIIILFYIMLIIPSAPDSSVYVTCYIIHETDSVFFSYDLYMNIILCSSA